ncbi:MAG: PorT family protein [Bacteroidales bacterium]|nr:PorT family protein [Bacteroidales bacterium]MBK7628550.1 PorT family protein [Bacteroidales bacterium]
MRLTKTSNRHINKLLHILLLFIIPGIINAQQKISLGVHADPVIGWFGSDIKETKNDGARPGFNFGLTFNKYFTPNYSFSTGISLLNTGGRLVSSDTVVMEFTNFKSTVLPGKSVIYKIQYVSVPIGLKLQTNQIGYLTFFTDLGLDPKVVVGGKADINSLNVSGEKAINELRIFNLSYHITAGIEYSLGGTTALVTGLGFENNFLDITKENGDQLKDKVTHKLLSFRLGVNF